MSRLSLRLRLTLVFALAMAVVLTAMAAFVYVRVGAALAASVDQSLRAQATETGRDIGHEHSLIDPDTGTGTRFAELLSARGAIVRTTTAGLAPLLGPGEAARVARGQSIVRTAGIPGRDGEWRLLAVPARSHGSPGALVFAASLATREETLHRLLIEFLVAAPIALLLASLAGYGVAAAALHPVESMRRRAAAIGASTPGRRLPVPGGGDEIARLAETLNAMLDRLEAAFEHERRFVADASHELRTPLALLRAELELALRRPRSHAELEGALRSAAEETERLTRLAEDLLLIARSEQGQLPLRLTPLPVAPLLRRVAERFAGSAAERGREIAVSGADGITVDGDEGKLEQALGNLVDNALVHGQGLVELVAQRRGTVVELHVRDAGAGFEPVFAGHAFGRFSRADSARGKPGSGLGLAIVDLIARGHQGAAHIGHPGGSGADVWIALPIAQRAPSEVQDSS
jgi:signal transduction histidine kinase